MTRNSRDVGGRHAVTGGAGFCLAAAAVRAAHAWPGALPRRNLHRLRGGRDLIEELTASHLVVAVEMGWPSTRRPSGVPAFVTTYGASHASGWAAAHTLGLLAPA